MIFFFQLVSAVLDDEPQLMFKIYFREDAKNFGTTGKSKRLKIKFLLKIFVLTHIFKLFMMNKSVTKIN